MASDEKPTSIWKKEISFRRKPGETDADAPADSGSTSIWKKEISLRKKDKVEEATDEQAPVEPPAETPAEASPDHELDAAIAALQPEPVAVAAEPEPAPTAVPPAAPSVEPAAAIEHDWLTKPLEEVSEPPAQLPTQLPTQRIAPVALVPELVEPLPVSLAAVPEPEPVTVPQSIAVPEPEIEPDPDVAAGFELDLHPVGSAAPTELPAPVLPVLPVLPELPVAEAEEPEPVPVSAPKVPFYKKELSLKRAPKERVPKQERPQREKPQRQKKEKKEQVAAASGAKPFYKRDLSFKRGPKEWDAGEALTEEKPKQKLRRPPRPRPSLPSLSRGGGKRIVGLKIGGSQIAAATVSNGDSLELVQAARTPLDYGIVVNGELRDPEALAVALRDFFAQHKLPKRGIRLGIANNRIGVRTFEVIGIEDPKQLANAIRFRAQEVLPIPLEEAVLDYQVLSAGVTEDGKPLRRVLLVVAYRELVDRYVYACRKAGLQVVGIDLEAFALLRAVAEPHGANPSSDRGALVAVAVGHDRSTFAVSDGRVCEFTRVLEWGGWALNVAIARALDMSPSEAEVVKRALTFGGVEQVPEGFTEDQISTAREASRRQLQTFARELVSSLQFYQNQPGSLGIGEIALTGGTAHMPGLGAELERLIGVPVRVVDPLSRLKVSKKVSEPEQVGSLAVAIGLGIED